MTLASLPVILPDRYELELVPIGRGGFGDVYRTWDREFEVPVAVKVARDQGDPGEEGRAFAAELRASARLRHPGFIQVLDAGEDPEGRTWLAMEYAAGGSIERWLRDGPPPWAELEPVLMALLDAIGFAHARGLVHRDIKPQNVLLDPDADGRLQPRLADFGLAKIRQERGGYGSTRLMAGTLLYMAPETFKGSSATIHPTVDLYAFGVLLYRLLSCELPWQGEGFSMVFQKTQAPPRHLEPRTGYEFPPRVADLVEHLLRRSPGERPQLAADVQRALQGLDAAPTSLPGAFPAETCVTGARLFPASPAVGLLREPLLVGRRAERASLWEAARAVTEGPIGLSLLGRAGAGRSRLALWLCRLLEESGAARSFRVRLEPDCGVGLALIRSLRRFFGAERVSVEELDRLVDERATALGLDPRDREELKSWLSASERSGVPGVTDQGAVRFGLFLTVLSAAADRGIVVLWFEDCGGPAGADAASCLLRLAGLDAIPLLLMYEPVGGAQAGPDGLAEVSFPPLSDDEILAILRDLAPFTTGLEEEATLARGCPQRAVETARLLATRGPDRAADSSDRSARTRPPHHTEVLAGAEGGPGSGAPLAAIGQERVHRFLAGEERDDRLALASLLALLPRPCPREDLAAAWSRLGADPAGLERALEASLVAGLTRRTEAGAYDLWGAAVEGAAKSLIDRPGQPATLAEACAFTVLDAAGPERRLAGARLLQRAGAADRAAHEAMEAGRALEGQDAVAARAAWDLALDCLRQVEASPPEPRAVAASLGLARLLRGTFALSEAARLLDELEDLELEATQRAEWGENRAAVHLLQGDAGEALRVAHASASAYQRLGITAGRSRALLLAADAMRRGGRPMEAIPLFEEALAVAERPGLEREQLGALWRLACARLRSGVREADGRARVRADLERALELARRQRAGNFEGIVLRELGNLAVIEGRTEEAEELLRRSIDQLRRCGLDGEAATTRISLGELARLRGDLEQARREYSVALNVTRSFGITQDNLIALIDLAMTELAMDRLPSVARRVKEIDRLLPRDRAHVHRPYIEAVRFTVHSAQRQFEEAERSFDGLAPILEQARPSRDLVAIVERGADAARDGDALPLAGDGWDLALRLAEALGDDEAVARLRLKAREIGAP